MGAERRSLESGLDSAGKSAGERPCHGFAPYSTRPSAAEMQVHPSRAQHVPQSDQRPRASDYAAPSSRRHSRSPPPHHHHRATSPAPDRGERRASPVYESYDRVREQRDDERRRDDEARGRERDQQRRDREARDHDRERRGIEHERRVTPDRELGNGLRGGYQGGYQGAQGGGQQRGGGGGGDDWFQQ